MGRRKIEIKAIKDDRNRSVTFLKRKGGLFKKAHELSVLCSVDVAVIIFGSNKKLYEYSSSDIGEILGRHNCYGGAGEHKGPADFTGKGGDDDDDDDMGSPPLSHHSQEHPMMPPQFANQPPYQHIRHHTPSASPPIPNGAQFHPGQRQHTPQPQVISRPNSRTGRRTSSSLAQVALPPGAQPVSNGHLAYMPNPPIYQPPQHGTGGPGHPQQSAPLYQYAQPPQPLSQPHQLQQVYTEDRRTSMPPAFNQQERHPSHPTATPPQPQHQQLPAQHQPMPQINQPQAQMTPQPPQINQPPPQHEIQQQAQQQQQLPQQQMLEPVKRMSVKSRSIFTPIDAGRSILSQHWGSTSQAESIKSEPAPASRSQSIDVGTVSRKNGGPSPPPVPARANTHTKPRNTSMSSMESFAPPSRTNSGKIGATRPRLALQIPDEPSDGGSQTAESSPRDTGTDATGSHPDRRGGTEGSHSSGVVLPPPSPSERSILSAGASGPPNPFARPHPPSQNSNTIETPVSALPSRFMSNDFLPSPSSFYPDWNFGRGSDSNTLPSPLNFATPIIPSGPSFLRDEPPPPPPTATATAAGANQKRKTPEVDEGGDSKRAKHE